MYTRKVSSTSSSASKLQCLTTITASDNQNIAILFHATQEDYADIIENGPFCFDH